MTTKHEVLAYFREHPDATSGQIGRYLGCTPAYVRRTLTRNGMKLKRSRPGAVLNAKRYSLSAIGAIFKERERCARIAEILGAKLVADAIRMTDE